MKQNKIIIFSNSYSPRTGHNFASEVLKIFTNHQVLAHNRSETRLTTFLQEFYKIYNSTIYHETDKDFFYKIILSDLRNKIIKKSDSKYVMIKDTTFVGVQHLKDVFPDDIHILILRNPIDVFASLFKAMSIKKKNFKNILKKVGIFIGLYPYYYSKKISKRIIKEIPDLNHFYIIKYEDFVTKNEVVLLDLKKKFESEKSIDQIKNEIDNINVINTSYFEETGAKNIWEAKQKTKDFNPINRNKHSYLVRLGIKFGTAELCKRLKY
jgi:Sulfotransferase family